MNRAERIRFRSWVFKWVLYSALAGLYGSCFYWAATTPAQYEARWMIGAGILPDWRKKMATAVFAFTELLDHLQRWEAPAPLQDWCGQIIDEERVHALMMSGQLGLTATVNICAVASSLW